MHLVEQRVEFGGLLRQRRVETLVVVGRVLQPHRLQVPREPQVVLDTLGDAPDHVLLRLAAAAARSRLEREDDREVRVRLVHRARDVGIVVHAEDLGLGRDRERVKVVEVRLARRVAVRLDRAVDARARELVALGEHGRVDHIRDDDVGRAHVLIVRDAPAVVDERREHAHNVVRHVVVHVDVELELRAADVEVGLVEAVAYIPAERAKLLALDREGMEEAEAVEKLAVDHRLVRLLQVLVRHLEEGRPHVGLEALRRLFGHLDAGLQHGDGEGLGGHRGEPEAELGVGLVLLHLLGDALELGHPRDRKVTVLKQDPVARLDAVGDVALGGRALALAERDRHHALGSAHFLGEEEQILRRVRARRQHEDERRHAARVVVARAEVERRRLNVLLARLLNYEVLHGVHHLVLAERADHAHALQRGEVVERLGEAGRLRLERVEDLLPLGHRLGELGRKLLEALDADHGADRGPDARGDPLGVGVLELDRVGRHARDEVAPLLRVDLARALHDLDREEEREEQLVLLEERAADVVVHREREVLVEVGAADLNVAVLWRHLHAADEERVEPRKRVLVHRVHDREVGEAEVEERGAVRDRPVALRGLEDLLRGDLGLGHLGLDLLGGRLRLGQRLDQRRVVEDVALGGRELEQDERLNVEELLVRLGVLHHQLGLALGQLGLLLLDYHAEQLLLEALLGHGEVDQRDLDLDLGRVVRVGQLGRHEEPEAVRVRHVVVAELDHVLAALLELLLQQDRLERGVELLAHVLHEHPLAEPDAVLERAQEILLGHLAQVEARRAGRLLQVLVAPHHLDVPVGLALRVDQQ
mmetsp:Transcript_6911/g.16610  ORF Transcript_6911/g.16610 Transcript_6911/m.16610 type:complete len:820 (-) Transcript_6911:3765-6224(-)